VTLCSCFTLAMRPSQHGIHRHHRQGEKASGEWLLAASLFFEDNLATSLPEYPDFHAPIPLSPEPSP
jgi:hypothetical protein